MYGTRGPISNHDMCVCVCVLLGGGKGVRWDGFIPQVNNHDLQEKDQVTSLFSLISLGDKVRIFITHWNFL